MSVMAPQRTTTAGFDPAAVRAAFPVFARRVNGAPLVYLDSAASAQKPEVVISAMSDMMRTSYANVHRGLHTLANEATETFEGARTKLAAFLGAGAREEIVFTRGSTEAINLVAAGLAHTFKAGDEIVISQAEHHSNIVPWSFLAERTGAVVKWARVDESGALDLDHLETLLGPRTRLVAVTHMSNVTGLKTDTARLIAAARAVGAQVLLDGSQAAVHLPALNVADLDVDYYVCTGHKLYGPTGIGALYAKMEHLERMAPYQGGGEMIESVSQDAITFAAPPHKFEAGTPVIIEAAGLAAALDWLTGLDRAAIGAHEAMLADTLAQGLADRGGVRRLGRDKAGSAIVTFHSPTMHAHDVAQILDQFGVAVRAGQHCAEPLMTRLGVTSSCRASFGAYNTKDDVDAFLAAFDSARAMLG